MDKKIAVVGMGQGGMTAAILLAKNGYDVTVFEKCSREEVGYDWYDDIRSDIFGICGLNMPDSSVYRQKSKWLFVSPNERESLPFPPLPLMEEISVSRKGLCDYFAREFEKVNGKIQYSTAICKLIIENEAVKGVYVGDEKRYFDLVIDASGMNSPLRPLLPEKYAVPKAPAPAGVLYALRAFYDRPDGAKPVEEGIDSTLILKHMGRNGISWCNLADGETDVLIGSVDSLDDSEIEEALADLKKFNSILGDKLIRGKRVQICLRATASRSLADGYAAIGDSAFMTMPLMGSGIESSMKAGKLFADHVIKSCPDSFTERNMWGYWHEYMTTQGADYAFIDIVKSWALRVDPALIDWVFGSGLIERSDLALISTDGSENKPKLGAKSICKKIFILLGHFGFVIKAVKVVLRALKAKKIAKRCPKTFDGAKVGRWQKKYERLLG